MPIQIRVESMLYRIRETLKNPTTLRENGCVIVGVGRVHGCQAARLC